MKLFDNIGRQKFLDAKERAMAEDKINADLELFKRSQELRIKEELFDKRTEVIEHLQRLNLQMLDDSTTHEHDYHQDREKKNTEIAKLDTAVTFKKLLFDELKDQKDVEIKLLKESNSTIVTNYKEMIELLKTQVEVLTAKLTELKITDAHLHVDVKNKE